MAFIDEDKHKEMLDKHLKIWSKIKSLTKNDFEAEPVYSNKSLKYKVKFYQKVIKTDFHDNKPHQIYLHAWFLQ